MAISPTLTAPKHFSVNPIERRIIMTHNEKTVTLKLKRIDVCDLLLACTLISAESNATKWDKLHDKLKQILVDFDEKNFKAE